MTPQDLCDLLDTLKLSNTDAAKRMGISLVTLEQYVNGRRYPSHGGKVITKLPQNIEILANSLDRATK